MQDKEVRVMEKQKEKRVVLLLNEEVYFTALATARSMGYRNLQEYLRSCVVKLKMP